MYEAILSDDGKYNVPDKFTSRTAEILQVYLKSLGVRMETILDDTNFIGEAEHNTTTAFRFGNRTIFCTVNEMYYLKKMKKVHKRYLKEHPNDIDDADEVWEYIVDNLPFKKKELTPEIIKLFKDNMDVLTDD